MEIVKKISLDGAIAGMVVCGDILDRNRNMLAGDGVTLTDGMIRSLKRFDIAEIAVKVVVDQEPADNCDVNVSNEAMLKTKIDRVDRMFQAHEAETINLTLKTMLVGYLETKYRAKN
jgi:hypothetical protein